MNTILIVQEEPLFRNYLRESLGREYEVLEAQSPVEALEVCRAHGEIDVLICDVNMGLVSGMELASLLRAWIGNLKTLLLTSLSRELWTDRQLAELNELPKETVQILPKPVAPQTLHGTLEMLTAEAVGAR